MCVMSSPSLYHEYTSGGSGRYSAGTDVDVELHRRVMFSLSLISIKCEDKDGSTGIPTNKFFSFTLPCNRYVYGSVSYDLSRYVISLML